MKKRGRKPQSDHPPEIRKKMAATKWYHKNHQQVKAIRAAKATEQSVIDSYWARHNADMHHMVTIDGWARPYWEPLDVYASMTSYVGSALDPSLPDYFMQRDLMLFVAQMCWRCTAYRLETKYCWRDEELRLLLHWGPLMDDFVRLYERVLRVATDLRDQGLTPTVYAFLKPTFIYVTHPLWELYTQSGLIETRHMEYSQPLNEGTRRARLEQLRQMERTQILDIQSSCVIRWFGDP